MKNLNQRYNLHQKDISYIEVVIIGNGPSGISLSYMLSGNWPYWKSELIKLHPDEMLRARLNHSDVNKSLIEQDLFQLAHGLEGRTSNPVSLLLDNLVHPGADIAMDLPSMVEYKYHIDKKIDHVVLGKGLPGGSWHRMDKNLRTLSLSAWMSLPNLNFNEWDNNRSRKRLVSKEVETRAIVHRVAEYYENYVNLMDLKDNFLSDTVVTCVLPFNKANVDYDEKFKDARWIVSGFNRNSNKPFSFACKNLVLANGSNDLANKLVIRGEGMTTSWLKYDLISLEKAIFNLTDLARSNLKPILIVGAGLSAADAVTICRMSGIQVIHVYRSRTAGLDKILPENIYPEYFEVHKMMKNSQNLYVLYKALPEHTIFDIQTLDGNRFVTVQNLKTGAQQVIEVSYCAVLIGSRPDLNLLSNISSSASINKEAINKHNSITDDNVSESSLANNLNPCKLFSKKLMWFKNMCAKCHIILGLCSRKPNNKLEVNSTLINMRCRCENSVPQTKHNGIGFGEDPKKPIDCKSNPIAVNKYSYSIMHAPEGLYALGPLVGDNFVRYIPGGALAITSALHKAEKHN
ncbi:unnamed protein product [Diamesa tonsa]